MNNILPVLALALVVISALLPSRNTIEARPSFLQIGTAFIAAILAVLVAQRFGKPAEGQDVMVGVGVGTVIAVVSSWLGRQESAVGLGVLGASVFALLPNPSPAVGYFALIASAGMLALILRSQVVTLTLLTSAGVVAASYLGQIAMKEPLVPQLGGFVVSIGLIGAIVGQALGKANSKVNPVTAWLPGILALVAGGVLGILNLKSNPVATSIALGVVAAGVVLLLVPDQDGEGKDAQDGLGIGISAIIWLSAASVSFGYLRGFGMALTLVGALTVLALSNQRRALLSVGPLLGLVVFRLLRESQPDVSRALDIGQHYALVGVALGMIAPLLPSDWRPKDENSTTIGGVLWAGLAVGLPVVAMLLFGGVGAVGLIAGTGFAGLLQVLRGRKDLQPLGVGLGMAGVMLLLTRWIDAITGLPRDEKLRSLMIASGIAAVIVVSLFALTQRTPATKQEVA